MFYFKKIEFHMWNRIQHGQWKNFLRIQRQKAGRLMLNSPMYRDKAHPIYNFILGYYHFDPSVLSQYSPGIGIMIDVDGTKKMFDDLPKKGRVVYK